MKLTHPAIFLSGVTLATIAGWWMAGPRLAVALCVLIAAGLFISVIWKAIR